MDCKDSERMHPVVGNANVEFRERDPIVAGPEWKPLPERKGSDVGSQYFSLPDAE